MESPRGTQGRPPEVHFYSLSGSTSVEPTADHPDAAQPHWQIALPDGTEPTAYIEFLGVWVASEHVIWEIFISDYGVRGYAIEVCNWRTGQITSRIDLATRPMHVVLLDPSYLLVTPRDDCPRSRYLTIFSISPTVPSRPLCTLQLPGDHKVDPEQPLSLFTMVMSPSSSPPGGHFRADPSMSMVVLTYEGWQGAHGILTTYLLIPFTTILAQIRPVAPHRGGGATADEQVPHPAPYDPPAPIPWEDWGARGCLRLRPQTGAYAMLPQPRVIPFSSRIPIVVYHDPLFRNVSIYVVDINPLAARHASSQARAAHESDRGATAVAVVEDVEGALPGVVDPECSAIPYVVYRFPLRDVSGPRWNGRPLRCSIWLVEMTMTGFALSLTTGVYAGPLPSWTV
ncbi:hypothetical protein GSI_02752 [Ganoderma sinense ZZ0214-1]|uniref:Uncharacterized protein n=1 Tax=Ganoderma sinense ZZ0214-1 TaxID=1077348 RepID=A0A2G8SMH1_9APHY|nr:hypothetical protein GSI_02752 [Ganoderma sinense ZZ0214-1]